MAIRKGQQNILFKPVYGVMVIRCAYLDGRICCRYHEYFRVESGYLYPSAIGAPWKENNINFNLNIKSTQAKYNGDATSDNRRAFQKNRDHKRCNTTLRAVRIDLQCHTQILRLPLYPEETISHIRFIKNSQSVGLSLEEIRELIHLQAQSGTTSQQVKTLIQ